MSEISSHTLTVNDYPVNIDEIMHKAYLQYSLSVNVGRAIPDVRDGLKPVARRILYGMLQLNLTHSRPFSKCAMVVGEVMGKYHPHGDSAIYDTLVRMAQDFSLRYPLIWGQGNFGSIDGDPPAAYRYTECRLHRLAEELLRDIDKNTVDMVPNYDGRLTEPVVLPAAFPNLLVNGSSGIGVGMATNIPPHNMSEVIDACIYLIEHPNASVSELMQFIKGPDFPTGGIIMGVNTLREMYETGKGSFVLRGKVSIENQNDQSPQIIITEIPYLVNKENLIARIAQLVNDKVIDGITNIRDLSSSRVGIRIVIDLKRNVEPNLILNQLYAHTPLQTSINSQFLVVDHYRPRTMSLPKLLQAYLDHRFEVTTRRTRFDLEKAEARAHILEGFILAVRNIEEVIRIIRSSRTREEAQQQLILTFKFTKIQSNAILDMRLHQLTGLAIEELQKEYEEISRTIEYLKGLLAERQALWRVICDELSEIKARYQDPRRTEILPIENDIHITDLIANEVQAITLSYQGYIKRMSLAEFQAQQRGGRGIIGMTTKEDDWVKIMIAASTHDYLLFFTDKGRMLWLRAFELPIDSRTSRGKALVNLIELEENEKVCSILGVQEVDVEGLYLLFATKQGIINRIALKEFRNLRKGGIFAIQLREGDELISVGLCKEDDDVALFSREGMVCRFSVKRVSPHGRRTMGVIGMRLKHQNDQVVSMVVLDRPNIDVLIVTQLGKGKKIFMGDGVPVENGRSLGVRRVGRGCQGVIAIRLLPGDCVATALPVEHHHHILAISRKGIMIRFPSHNVRVKGRSARGVTIMDLDEGDQLVSIARVEADSTDIEEEGEGMPSFSEEEDEDSTDLDEMIDEIPQEEETEEESSPEE